MSIFIENLKTTYFEEFGVNLGHLKARVDPRGGGSRPWANTMEFQEMFVLKTTYFEEFGVNLGHLKAQVDPRGDLF